MAENKSTCTVDGCDRKHYAKSYCNFHWQRWRKTGSIADPAPREPRQCDFEGCERSHESRGLCGQHATQLRKHGKLNPISPARSAGAAEHLAFYTHKTDSCWLWTGSKDTLGYGQLHRGGVMLRAHRLAYELAYGRIADGLVVDHKCYTPSCVNPQHLQAVTRKENGENRRGVTVRNTSGVRGVHWAENVRKWRAQVGHYGGTVHVGDYEELADAEKAVKEARKRLFTNSLGDTR